MADAGEMINRCFRHQHPEAYGRAEVGNGPSIRENQTHDTPTPFGMNAEGNLPEERPEELAAR